MYLSSEKRWQKGEGGTSNLLARDWRRRSRTGSVLGSACGGSACAGAGCAGGHLGVDEGAERVAASLRSLARSWQVTSGSRGWRPLVELLENAASWV